MWDFWGCQRLLRASYRVAFRPITRPLTVGVMVRLSLVLVSECRGLLVRLCRLFLVGPVLLWCGVVYCGVVWCGVSLYRPH